MGTLYLEARVRTKEHKQKKNYSQSIFFPVSLIAVTTLHKCTAS